MLLSWHHSTLFSKAFGIHNALCLTANPKSMWVPQVGSCVLGPWGPWLLPVMIAFGNPAGTKRQFCLAEMHCCTFLYTVINSWRRGLYHDCIIQRGEEVWGATSQENGRVLLGLQNVASWGRNMISSTPIFGKIILPLGWLVAIWRKQWTGPAQRLCDAVFPAAETFQIKALGLKSELPQAVFLVGPVRLKISQQPRADPAPVGLLLQLSGFASKQMRFGHLSEGGEKMSSCFGMLQLPLSKSIFIVHSHMCRNYPQHVRCAIHLYSLSHLPFHGTQAPPILNFKALQCIHWRPSNGKKREYRSHYKHSAQKRNDKRNSVISRSPNLGALCCLDPKAWENYNILKGHLEWWLCFCQSSWMTLGHSASA